MTATLKDLAGTTRGLGNLTVVELQALLSEHSPVKVTGKAKGTRGAKTDKPKSKFYTDVIVGKREERETRTKANRAASAWMREKGLVPQGQAWAAVRNGERSVTKLRSLNEADGLAPLKMKAAGVEAVVAEKAERVAEKVEAKVETKTEAKTRAPRKAKAAKATVEVATVTAEPEAVEPVADETDALVAMLVSQGFTEDSARRILGS